MKNKEIWDWTVLIQKNNKFVNMWLVKNHQTYYEIKTFYFIFCVCKMYLISAKGEILFTFSSKKTGEIWANIKNEEDSLGVQSISDLVLKEVYGIYKTKDLTKEQIKKYEMTEREMFEKYVKLSENELNTKTSKDVYAKNDVMTTLIKCCRGKKNDVKEK